MMMIKRNFSLIDSLGIVAAILCIAHCLVTTFVLTFLPYYVGKPWTSELTHQIIACIAVLICIFSIQLNYRRTKDRTVFALFLIGMLFLMSTSFLLPENLHQRYEIYLVLGGSALLVIGHIRNIRQLARCCKQN